MGSKHNRGCEIQEQCLLIKAKNIKKSEWFDTFFKHNQTNL